jgi:hypothetical protein
MDNCIVKSSEAATPLISLDAVAGGGHYFFAKNCEFVNFGTNNVLYFGGYADVFITDCKIVLYGNVTGTAIYFDTPSTSIRGIFGSMIDVTGSTSGLAVSSRGAINLQMNRCDYRRANHANVTLLYGSVSNNSVWTTDFVCV